MTLLERIAIAAGPDVRDVRMSHATFCELQAQRDAGQHIQWVPPNSFYGATAQLHGWSIHQDDSVPAHTVQFHTRDSHANSFEFGWNRRAWVQ